VRVVDVVPPGQGDEGMGVFLTAAFVLLVVIYVIGFERDATFADRRSRASETLPFQVLFRDLPGPEQRIYREMQEATVEVLAARGSNGAWPSVESLAGDGIPPFAPDPLDEARMRWQLVQRGLVHQYVGIPAVPDRLPTFMLSIVEPDPKAGEVARPGTVDEEHQLLPDGTLLHVTYWKRKTGAMPRAPVLDPPLDGWTQIRTHSLFEELGNMQ
jgi:hypothetical protein